MVRGITVQSGLEANTVVLEPGLLYDPLMANRRVLSAFILLCLACASAIAENAPGRISIEVQDADIRSVFSILSEASGRNIVLHSEVGGRITLRLEDVHWRDALGSIARSRGLYVSESGNVIMVVPYDKVRETLGGAGIPQ